MILCATEAFLAFAVIAAVMQHRMLKQAQKAMAPWMYGQPVYANVSNTSSQGVPLLYSGEYRSNKSMKRFI